MKKRRLLTDSEVAEMRELRARGLAIEAIAAETCFSKSAVHRAVKDMPVDRRLNPDPLPPRKPPTWFKRAARLAATGMSRYAIADQIGIPRSVVYRVFDKFG